MFTDQDKIWLEQNHPKLSIGSEEILGTIEFTSSYNDQISRFFIQNENTSDNIEGYKLSGSFKIYIRDRLDKKFSNLPALSVEDVETTMDRHFSQFDKSACLCSPLEENEFLFPTFKIQAYIEQLVIPFLYGQLFYSIEKKWPWLDLAHGGTGLLESYFRIADSNKAQECLEKLSKVADWKQIKSALLQKSDIKGHTSCFCPKKDHIRRCHPDAWNGIKKLKNDIKILGLKFN